jgi:hypothetical protein
MKTQPDNNPEWVNKILQLNQEKEKKKSSQSQDKTDDNGEDNI